MHNNQTPQKLAKDGQAAFQRGEYQEAARFFEEAKQAYLLAGDQLNAAENANNCSVSYLKGGEAEAALKIVEGTEAIFAHAGDIRRQGMALGNVAAALESLDRFEEAAQAYQQSADLLQQVGEDQLRADALRSLSSLQLRLGHQSQALFTMQNGLNGVKHPTPTQRLTRKLLHIPFNLLNKNKA